MKPSKNCYCFTREGRGTRLIILVIIHGEIGFHASRYSWIFPVICLFFFIFLELEGNWTNKILCQRRWLCLCGVCGLFFFYLSRWRHRCMASVSDVAHKQPDGIAPLKFDPTTVCPSTCRGTYISNLLRDLFERGTDMTSFQPHQRS